MKQKIKKQTQNDKSLACLNFICFKIEKINKYIHIYLYTYVIYG